MKTPFFESLSAARDVLTEGELGFVDVTGEEMLVIKRGGGVTVLYRDDQNAARAIFGQTEDFEVAESTDETSIMDVDWRYEDAEASGFWDFFTAPVITGLPPGEWATFAADVKEETDDETFTLTMSVGGVAVGTVDMDFEDTPETITVSGGGVTATFTLLAFADTDCPVTAEVKAGQALPEVPLNALPGSRVVVNADFIFTNDTGAATTAAVLAYIGGESFDLGDVSIDDETGNNIGHVEIVMEYIGATWRVGGVARSLGATPTLIPVTLETDAAAVELATDRTLDVTLALADEDADIGWKRTGLSVLYIPAPPVARFAPQPED